jgi:hypothetical protein
VGPVDLAHPKRLNATRGVRGSDSGLGCSPSLSGVEGSPEEIADKQAEDWEVDSVDRNPQMMVIRYRRPGS